MAIVNCAAFVVILWGVVQAKEFLVPVFTGALLAFLMAPLVRLLKKRARFPEWLAVGAGAVVLLVPLAAIAALIVNEAQHLVHNWPQISASIKKYVDDFLATPFATEYHLSDYLDLESLQDRATQGAGEGAMYLLSGLRTLFSAGTQLAIILFFAILMLVTRRGLRRSVEDVLAVEESPQRAKMLDSVTDVMQDFLVARSMIVAFVAGVDLVVLKLFGVPYAVTLSVLLGLSTLIPAVGFLAAIIPPIIILLAEGRSHWQMLAILGILWAVSSFQDHYLAPKLIGQRLKLNFLATYLALFAGERVWGIWGMFLAIPILGLIRIVLSTTPDLRIWARLLEEPRPEEDGH
jgi:predicted PurR-regulated permease PerM